MISIKELDIARNWEPLHEALQQHVRRPLLRDYSDSWKNTDLIHIGEKFTRNGQISANDSEGTVLWYTLSYSCMHFDALRDLMNLDEFKQVILLQNSRNMSVLHVDFGCGPGTSTWAVIKSIPATVHLETIGHDHNPRMTNLAQMMVQTISKSAEKSVTFDFLSDRMAFQRRVLGNERKHDLLLVTVNSLFGQDSLPDSYLSDMLVLVKRLRAESPESLIMIFGTHPKYRPEFVVRSWQRIAEYIGAVTVYDLDRKIDSWSPLKCTQDIQDSWYPWMQKIQLTRILVLPPTGGKR